MLELRKRIRDRRHRLLLALARHGNEDAFRQLYRELYRPVALYIRRRTQNREDAEDLCSEVFRKFLVGLDRFDPSRGSVMGWVVAMAHNTLIDEYRRRGPPPQEFDSMSGPLAGALPDVRPGPLRVLIGREEMDSVRDALARQPSEIREMFSLRFEQDMRVREVAAVMGISPDAAKQRFARALRTLREDLAERKTSRRGEESCESTD